VSDAVVAECAKVIGAEHTFTADLDRVPERRRQSIKEPTQGIRQAADILEHIRQRRWKLEHDYGNGCRVGLERSKELIRESFRIQE
jgi:hypothetical protein